MATAAYLFNNLKPEAPVIQKIVPLLVRDEYERDKVVYYQRIRIYFSKVPLTGKDNRIGIIVRDPASVYPTMLKSAISRAGKDIVTDQLGDLLDMQDDQLSAANFNLDPGLLEEEYKSMFKPKYDNGQPVQGPNPIGIVNYTVRLDKDQSLHYIDTEIKVRGKGGQEFHNPFVQLFLVCYQPLSANYNNPVADTQVGYNADYRLSASVKAEFVSIYPSRSFSNPMILFKRHPKGWCTLSGDTSSLFFSQADKNNLHTDFIISVQKRVRHGMWETQNLKSATVRMTLDGKAAAPVAVSGPLPYVSLFSSVQPDMIKARQFECDFQVHFAECFLDTYRVVIYEVDCFNGLGLDSLTKALCGDNRPSLLTITGAQIRNTYVFEDK
jgi:hypothetical protein